MYVGHRRYTGRYVLNVEAAAREDYGNLIEESYTVLGVDRDRE